MSPRHLVTVLSLCASSVGAAMSVSTNFESGSARVLELDAEAQRVRISPAGDVKRGMPNWWYLRVDGIDTNKPLTVEVAARVEPVPGHLRPDQPLAAGWALPNCAAMSMDGTDWKQSPPGQRNGNQSTYRITAPAPTVWLAWGPPFTPADASAFVDRIAGKHSLATAFVLAKSREGRAVPALRIFGGEKPAAERRAIWIQARQHAWESGGSWVAVGVVEWLVSGDEKAKWMRENAEVFVVPVMDVDQVATGDGGKHALPRDHNLDWSEAPHWPEVAAAQKRIRELAREGRMALYLDLHNPSAGQRLQSFYLPFPPDIPDETARLQERFLAGCRRQFGEIQLHDVRPPPQDLHLWRPGSNRWIRENCGPQTIAFTVETPWNTPQGTPAGYREAGRKLGLAIEEYLNVK